MFFHHIWASTSENTYDSVLSSGVTSIIFYRIDNDFYRAVASGFAYAIPCIIGSRLSTNLAEVGQVGIVHSNDNGIDYTTMSDIQFASSVVTTQRGTQSIVND